MHKTGDGGKKRNGLGFTTTAELDAHRLFPPLSPRGSCSKGQKGCHLQEGLRSMSQMLVSLVPACFNVQDFPAEDNHGEEPV